MKTIDQALTAEMVKHEVDATAMRDVLYALFQIVMRCADHMIKTLPKRKACFVSRSAGAESGQAFVFGHLAKHAGHTP